MFNPSPLHPHDMQLAEEPISTQPRVIAPTEASFVTALDSVPAIKESLPPIRVLQSHSVSQDSFPNYYYFVYMSCRPVGWSAKGKVLLVFGTRVR